VDDTDEQLFEETNLDHVEMNAGMTSMLFSRATRTRRGQRVRHGIYPIIPSRSSRSFRLSHAAESLPLTLSRVLRVAGRNSNHQLRATSTQPRVYSTSSDILGLAVISGGFHGFSQSVIFTQLIVLAIHFPFRSDNARR
jgi:hypothetical protein